jgi:hypothetical protein
MRGKRRKRIGLVGVCCFLGRWGISGLEAGKIPRGCPGSCFWTIAAGGLTEQPTDMAT